MNTLNPNTCTTCTSGVLDNEETTKVPHYYAQRYCTFDNLYQANCVHEQKTHGLQWTRSIGMAMMANQKTPFVRFRGPCEIAHLTKFSTNFDCWPKIGAEHQVISPVAGRRLMLLDAHTYMYICPLASKIIERDRLLSRTSFYSQWMHMAHCFGAFS